MGWLMFAAAYSTAYGVIGMFLRRYPAVLPWFRSVALLIPPLAGVAVIARLGRVWPGRQWVLWASIAAGLVLAWTGVIEWSVLPVVSVLPILVARLATERDEHHVVNAKLRLMAAAVEEANELILIVSEDGRVRHANRAFCRAIGSALRDLIDQPPGHLLAAESVPRIEEMTNLAEGSGWAGTLIHQRKDGTTFQAA